MPPLFHDTKSADLLDALRVCSLSHRSCGLPALGGVIAHGDGARVHAAIANSGIECVVLSTCNRFEIYWRSSCAADDDTVAALMAATLPSANELIRDASTRLAGENAARHLFRVCSGLESMVLGEAEILGQARTAMEQASPGGSFLRGIFTAAIRTGRGARSATGISAGAMSVASAAIQQLERRVSVRNSRVLLIGAGETAVKVARQLTKIGVLSLVVANRTIERAQSLAETHGGVAIGLDRLSSAVASADVIISASHAESWLIRREHLVDRSAARPVAIVDLSMPPAVEPCAIDGVTRIDLADVERATAAHRQRRESEIPRVEALIDNELAWLRSWARQEQLRPLVSTLRQKADGIRRDELERAREELKAGDAHAVLERASKRMFDRLLNVPLEQLKSGDLPYDGASAEYLRRLFALDEGPSS